MSKRTIRTCSFCHEPGHTIRDCVEAERDKKLKKKHTGEKPVVVRVVHEGNSSPHVIHLKPEEVKKQIQVSAFREKMEKIHTAREQIDVAALVRAANANKQKQEEVRLARETARQAHAHALMLSEKQETHKKKSSLMDRLRKPSSVTHDPIPVRSPRIPRVFAIPTVAPKKFAASFAVALVLITLPFPAIGYYKKLQRTQEQVINQSTNAFFALQASTVAALQSDLVGAQHDLNTALSAFNTAQDIVDKEHTVLQYVAGLVPMLGDQVRSRQHVLLAGHHLALGNTYLVKGIDAATKNTEVPLSERMNILRAHLKSAMPQYEKALDDLGHIDPKAIPVEYQQSFAEFKLLFAAFIDDMQDLSDLIDVMNIVFGAEDFRRYLLVFQNHHEIRPTGGFMGSFAILDVQKGKIEKVEVPPGGTYDLQGQLDAHVKPPLPLQLVAGRWEFQDANWFPDFAASAEKMEWFYEHGRKTSVDGVIAINASVLERFLRVVGPVSTSEKYNLLLDADSALTQIQHTVEVGTDKKENKPKLIISELLNQFLGGVQDLSKVELLQILSELHDAAEKKEIQVYMNDRAIQDRLRNFGWTGEIAHTPATQDYLMTVNTNLQGQKSDAKIVQEIFYDVVVGDDGSVIAQAKIKRKHTGKPNEAFYGSMNINYLRLFVPEGAELIEATGFSYPPDSAFHVPEEWYQEDADIKKYEQEVGMHVGSGTRVTKEFGKTVFGNWVMVEPGKEVEVTFTYKLPFKIVLDAPAAQNGLAAWKEKILDSRDKPSRYSLLVQKQSGAESDLHVSVTYPENWQPVWKLSEDTLLQQHTATHESKLDTDTAIGIIMEKLK